MNNRVEVKDLLEVFIGEVVECIKTPSQVDEFAYHNSEPKYFELRVRTQVGGCYWSVRAVSTKCLPYDEGRELETRMNEYFHSHCRGIMDAYEGLATPEYQD